MKKTIIAAVLALSTIAQAEGRDKNKDGEFCELVELAAEKLMIYRQEGGRMSQVIALAKGDKLRIKITEDAWTVDRRFSDSMKAREVSDFANKWYVICFNGLKD